MKKKKNNFLQLQISIILSFFVLFLLPTQTSAAGTCCVYSASDTSEKFGDDAGPIDDVFCINEKGETATTGEGNNAVVVKTDIGQNLSCPAGYFPDTLVGAFYVYDRTLELSDCGDPSGWETVVVDKNSLYCTVGIKTIREESVIQTQNKMAAIMQPLFDAVHTQRINSSCCVPLDPQKTPHLSCAKSSLKANTMDRISKYFLSTDTLVLLPDEVDSIDCGSASSAYRLYPTRACDQDIVLPANEVISSYSLSGLGTTMRGMCGTLRDNAAVQPKDKIDFVVQEKSVASTLPTSAELSQKLNPLGTFTPQQLLGRIIKSALGILGSIALVIFLYGGIMWMTSMGSSDKIQKSLSTLVWGALGVIVILASYSIVSFVLENIPK